MTTINQELYEALIAAGAPDDTAKRAAASVYDKAELVTRADLRAELTDLRAALEARLAPIEADLRWTKWIITGGVGLYVLRSLIEWLR